MRWLLTICLFCACGCATKDMHTRIVYVPAYTCIVVPDENVNALSPNTRIEAGEMLAGFAVPTSGVIVVRWNGERDENGEPEPDFYTFGHEAWHMAKGKFHK